MVAEADAQRLVFRTTAESGRRCGGAGRLTPEARRPMGDEIRSIFEGLGLTGPFWRL